MRYLYIDEAGISQREPIAVVIALIVNADRDYLRLEHHLGEVLRLVPEPLRSGFVSHATDIWNDRSLRQYWSKDDRINFLKTLVAIPKACNTPFCVAFARQGHRDPEGILSPTEFRHQLAFGLCVAHADRYVRKYGDTCEVATLVVEDCPPMRKFLRSAVKKLQKEPFVLPGPAVQVMADEEDPLGEFKVQRIRDGAHFVSKEDGPLLQIVDACAFAWRRLLNEQSLGTDLLSQYVSNPKLLDAAKSKTCGVTIYAPHRTD